MAKLFIIKEPGGDRSPFLRGILVRSLVNAGLDFDDAYELAQQVRDDLHTLGEIKSTELRTYVAGLLAERYGSEQRVRYEARPRDIPELVIRTPTRNIPFSVGILAHSLETCAIDPEMAMKGARRVLASLRKTGHREIDHKALRRVIYRCLQEHCSEQAANRYLSWRRFENSGIPLIILIGGITGSGKSTISSELAYRLDISRHQSTDMMREIIRSYLSPQMVPTLGYSSFEAWRGLPVVADVVAGPGAGQVVEGFLSQFAAMKLALEATIDRAIEEHHHLILEGVHIIPTELQRELEESEAIIVPLMLACTNKETLFEQLKRRGREQHGPQESRYQDRMDDIWELQSWLLDEADRAGVPIIANRDIRETVYAALDIVIGTLMTRFPPMADREAWGA